MIENDEENLQKRSGLRTQLKTDIGKSIYIRRPMKILIIGRPGVGKSSFGNSLITALQDYNKDLKHIERFKTGTYDNQRGVTLHLQRFEMNLDDDICWPTIIDLAGFENENTELIQEILLLILNGYIPNQANLAEIKEYGKNHGTGSLRQMYSSCDESMRIDRIIFVASAAENEDLPLNLIDCVVSVAVPEKPHKPYFTREIPLFGVLTKNDTVDQTGQEAFKKKEKLFKYRLGIDGSTRYICCTSYCDKIYRPEEETWSVLPRLDIPILFFLKAVLSPLPTAGQDTVCYRRPPMTSTGSQTEQVPGLSRSTINCIDIDNVGPSMTESESQTEQKTEHKPLFWIRDAIETLVGFCLGIGFSFILFTKIKKT